MKPESLILAVQEKEMKELHGKVAVVTGAASGIGLGLSERFLEEGMKLAKRCNELLSTTELRVSRLQTAFAEQMRLVNDDFKTEE